MTDFKRDWVRQHRMHFTLGPYSLRKKVSGRWDVYVYLPAWYDDMQRWTGDKRILAVDESKTSGMMICRAHANKMDDTGPWW